MTCECGAPAYARGLCRRHYDAERRAGRLPRKTAARDRNSYAAVHARLLARRGRAAGRPCAAPDCSTPARVWAWQRTGPQRRAAGLTWGLDLADYAPMCQPHATMLDGGGTLTHCPRGHVRAEVGTTVKGSCRECHRELNRSPERTR